jgi:hypothetical protein
MCSGNETGNVAVQETLWCVTAPVGITNPSLKLTAD